MYKSIIAIMCIVLVLSNSGYAQTLRTNEFPQTLRTNEFQNIESVPGYLITKDIKVTRSKAANTRFDMTIKAGRVCTKSVEKSNWYEFELIDCWEAIELNKNVITYYEPSQDMPPKRYAKRSVFNQSAKKVTVYKSAPNSWKNNVTVILKPKVKEYLIKVAVKPVVIKDKTAVYVESDGNPYNGDFKQKKTSMYNKTVYEISFYTDSDMFQCYSYNGMQLVRNNIDSNGEFLKDFASTMMVDENGYCFAKGYEEDSTFQPCNELSCVAGEYPELGFVGWLSSTQMVINDMLYDVVK